MLLKITLLPFLLMTTENGSNILVLTTFFIIFELVEEVRNKFEICF